MIKSKKSLLSSILRQDFASFISKTFATINPGIEYEHNWHIDLLADYLTSLEDNSIIPLPVLNYPVGEQALEDHKPILNRCKPEMTKFDNVGIKNGSGIKRLIINIPPRSLKSVCVSVAWPAWILGHDPTKRIMVASYAQSLSIKHSLDTRLVMNSEWYQELFPHTRLSKKHNLKSKFMTTEHGFRMATSVGGMSTGEGGDILIIDDPHNPSHIHSPKRRKNVIEWYEQTFSSRLNNKKKGVVVLVMQRLHEEDLAGHLLENSPGTWHLLKLPIFADEDIIYKCGKNIHQYEAGHSLHNARYDVDVIDFFGN